VQASARDRPLAWRFEKQATIRTDEESAVGVFDTREELIGADSAGRLYVLEYLGHHLHVFEPTGRFVRTLGRKGSGPGEFGQPYAFAADPDGTVAVYDLQKRRLVRFGPGGAILEERQLPGRGFASLRLHHTGEGYIYSYGPYPRPERGLYHSAASGDGLISLTPFFRNSLIRFQTCAYASSGTSRVFSPGYRWSARGNRVAFVSGARYEIVVHDGQRVLMRIRRPFSPRRATVALARKELGSGWRIPLPTGTVVCDPEEVVRLRGFEPEIPLIARVAMAPNGELWVGRGGVKGEVLPADVFRNDGEYLGTIPAGAPFPAAFLPDGRIAAYELDEMDVGRIVIYRVAR
jgi:hypothetical protein